MTPRSSAAPTCAMAVMGKASIPGRAKTRLVPPLHPEEAARLNTAFLQDAVGNVIAAGGRAYVAYGPQGSAPFFREHLPAHVGLIEACLPNFGDCLYLAIETMFRAGHGAACVINSDSPTLPPRLLRDAARLLAMPGDRAVLGPSEDGGYYLLGLKSARRALFESIDWSTDRVAGQTQRRAAAAGLPLTLLEPWYDVDDAAALRRLQRELTQPPGVGGPVTIHAAPATRRALAALLADPGFERRLSGAASPTHAPASDIAMQPCRDPAALS